MDQISTNYFTRRIGVLEDKLNELFSPELNCYMDIYLDYSCESFLNLIVLLLQTEITKDIPLTNVDSDFFSNIDLYGKIGEQIKSNYHIRIMEYYFRRNKYL